MRIWGSDKIRESELIEGCKKGDRKMQKQLYGIFAPGMFAICLRYAGDHQQAEDMLQEGFIRVFGNIGKFRGDGSFEGWMKRIFINSAIEGYRKNLAVNHMVEVTELKNDLVQDDDFHHLAAADLLRMVQALSPGYRTVFNLYAIEGYSHKEIADMLGINIGTSKSQLARARMMLQKMVFASQKVSTYAAVF